MSNIDDINNETPPRSRRRRRQDCQDILLPDGEVLMPRARWASDKAGGICDKSAAGMNLPTVYIGNVAYVKSNASLEILADRVKRRNEAPKHRRTARG